MSACPRCLAPVEAGERFCTRCGAELELEPEPIDVPAELVLADALAAPAVPAEPAVARSWPRRAKIALAVLAGTLVLATGAAVFLGLELSTTIEQKEQTEARLAASQQELDETEEHLRESETLSSRRKAVLEQTDRVLSQVDPLLTSVDRMKAITNDMTVSQDSFADNAGLVVSSLSALLDYVVQVEPLYWNLPYIYSLLEDVESGASAAGADQGRFEALERRYRDASRTFGNRATRYVRAVERLERQLSEVTG